MVASTLADCLGMAGCEVRMAADGVLALAVAANWRCDLLVTDLEMPRLDGLGLLVVLRRQWPGLPALIVTGTALAVDRLSVLSSGAPTELLRKPVGMAELQAALARVGGLAAPPPG